MAGIDEASERIDDLPPTEREVYTTSYELSVAEIVDQWTENRLVVPHLQRRYVWTTEQAGRLIESLLLQIPIPLLYFAEQRDETWEIIDGQQRVMSLVRFIREDVPLRGLSVLAHLNGLSFSDLDFRQQRQILSSVLRVVVIAADSHPAMVHEIFARLNAGATALTPQEMRAALYEGPLMVRVAELAQHPELKRTLGAPALRRRLGDQELVLRFIALRERLADYRPPLARFLDDFAQSHLDVPPEVLDDYSDYFNQAVTAVGRALGKQAFRLLDHDGKALDRSPNRAIFDAQMIAFSWWNGPPDELNWVKTAVIALSDEPAYRDAVSASTADRSRTLARIGMTVGALRGYGLSLRLPGDIATLVPQ